MYLCLYPWSFDFSRPFPGFDPQWYKIRTNGDWVDCVANFLFYVPFGLSCFLWLRHPNLNRRILIVIMSAAFLSCAVELIQIYVPTRNCSLRDVLFNTAGALAGVFLARLISLTGTGSRPVSQLLPPDRFAWVLFILWLIWHAFPFTPVLRIYKLKLAWETLLHPSFSFVSSVDIVFALLLLSAATRRRAPGWRPMALPLLAALLLPAQLALPDQTLSLDRIVAALIGLFLYWLLSSLFPERTTAYTLAWALWLWLIIRACYPFHLQPEPQPFGWVPFDAIIANFRGSLARLIAGKVFLYSGAIWAFSQARWSLPHATLFVVVTLGVIEFLQTYLAGHQPESTDLALALLGALLIAILSRGQVKRGYR